MDSQSIPIPIRFKDIDMHQHVNNAVYFTYMEYARTAVIVEEFLNYKKEGIQFLVSEANCKYKRPIKLEDSLLCDVRFAPVRPTSFDIIYIFRNAESGQVYAEGITRMVTFNENTGRPIAIPEWITKKFLDKQ